MTYNKFNNVKPPSKKLLINLSVILIILTISSLIIQAHQYNAIKVTESRNQLLKSELNQFALKNPSIENLQKFLSKDDTDQKDELSRDCKDTANILRLNARKNGYNMCIVLLDVRYVIKSDSRNKEYWAPSSGLETINGITLDNGTFVYVNPQNDRIIKFDRYLLEWEILERNKDALVTIIINESYIW